MDDLAVIAALEEARAAAIVAADVATLEAMTDADYVHVEASGRVRTRAEFLETLRSGAARFERYELSDNRIQLYGDSAVVTGQFTNVLVSLDGNRTTKTARHMRVYVRRAAGWANVCHQATEIAVAGRVA